LCQSQPFFGIGETEADFVDKFQFSASMIETAVTAQVKRERFVHRHLDPASRMGEILFGLIMVLSVTLTAGLTVTEGKAGVRQLLVAALGCNIAWGIIDGIMYVMNCMAERSVRARLVRAIQGAPDPGAALEIIRNQVEPQLEPLAESEDRQALYRAMLKHLAGREVPKTSLEKADLYGGLACFLLVFVSCLPVVAPFLIFSNPTRALRVSNFLLIAMLFAVGRKWATYSNANQWVVGLAMVTIGLLLVGVAVLLGG
jgi:VIT1/CCC1 family predicted Fe2+/Mn2+ transporter